MASLMLSVMGAFAEFERALIHERQREGIALAKQRGAYKGRKKSLSETQVGQLRAQLATGISKAQVAREFGISRETLYQYLKGRHQFGGMRRGVWLLLGLRQRQHPKHPHLLRHQLTERRVVMECMAELIILLIQLGQGGTAAETASKASSSSPASTDRKTSCHGMHGRTDHSPHPAGTGSECSFLCLAPDIAGGVPPGRGARGANKQTCERKRAPNS